MQYAPVPHSGISGDKSIKLEDILKQLKPIAIKKPAVSLVGSIAIHGESNNDIDIVISGDYSERDLEAITFRLYREFSALLGIPYQEIAKYVHIFNKNDFPYTTYIPIYELTLVPIKNPEKIEMKKFRMDGSFTVQKGNKRIIAGYASVVIPDDEGDIITYDALKNGIKTLLNDKSYANILLNHQNIPIGKIIEQYGDLETHVDDKGLFIVAEIRDDLEIANQVWEQILKGEINGFSIAGEVIDADYCSSEEACNRKIKSLNIFEISVCKCPVNPMSTFQVITKSDLTCMCKELNKVNNMVEEQVVEVKEEQKQKIEEKTEDPVLALLKEIKALLLEIKQCFDKNYPYPYPYPPKYPYPQKSNDDEPEEMPEDDIIGVDEKTGKKKKVIKKDYDKEIEDLKSQINQLNEVIEKMKKTEQPKSLTNVPIQSETSSIKIEKGKVYRV